MKTIFLRFANETAADNALAKIIGTGAVVDVIGRLYETTSEANGVPGNAPLPGWHVNLLAEELPAGLEPYEIFPESPSRVFAVEPEVVRVPQEVTMGQCRLALFDQHGIETDEQFFALVDQLPEAQRARALLELRTRPTVRRDNTLVQALGLANGWDLDALFVYAGAL